MSDLAERVEALQARQDILDCLNRYSRGIDRCDIDMVAENFHEDAVQDTGLFVGSARGWAESVTKFHLNEGVCQQHHLTNSVIELDGDTAHVESYYLAIVQLNSGSTKIVSGRWIDRFEKREQGWRIAVRVSTTESVVDGTTADLRGTAMRYVPWTRDGSDLSYERPLQPLRASADNPFRALESTDTSTAS